MIDGVGAVVSVPVVGGQPLWLTHVTSTHDNVCHSPKTLDRCRQLSQSQDRRRLSLHLCL